MVEKENNKKAICLSVPQIQGNEWKYVKECLDTNWVSSSGEYVNKFEGVVANYIGRKFAVACINGTSALHIALMVAGIRPDEEVLLPGLTFVASANAVKYIGAYPVFIDVESNFLQIDPDKVNDFLTRECKYSKGKFINLKTKRAVKAILPVHLLGHSVDMDPILKIAERFGLKVIEDAAQSLGGLYKERKVGSLGELACLSFNGNKIITTGGGGMILTDNQKLAQRARYFITQARDDALEHIHNEIGYNYRLTNIQAAIGVAQMEQLDEFIVKKRQIAKKYNEALTGVKGITLPQEAQGIRSIFWLYTILIDKNSYGLSNKQLLEKLKAANIETRLFWHPLYSLPPFKDCYAHRMEVVDDVHKSGLSLPCSVGLTPKQQDKVIEIIGCCIAGSRG
ncbi:MAG: LegC family aminotransferase [Candidatus Omnitrophica bacterium]|nr:LegC family aminotransferase [Candidatus Omnitrophota bacterium]MBU2265899.1 LegC family aminotransferase [Candidatus Omnitrophota bacterium]